MNRKGFTLIEMMVAIVIIAVIVLFVYSALNRNGYGIDLADFNRIMAQEGIQNPVRGPYQWGACADDDLYNSAFSGTKNGYPVSGVVCKGTFNKAYTVRYF